MLALVAASLSLRALRVFRGARVVVALDSLEVPAGGRLAVLGPNGAGKTSLLHALVGAAPFEGTVEVGGVGLTRRTLREIRRVVGLAFAEPGDQLFSSSALEEVAFGFLLRGAPRAQSIARARDLLARFRLEPLEARSPREMSLGEQKRLALAAVLATEPGLLLLDEPTSGLDPRARREWLADLERLPATLVVATHDLELARRLKGTVLLLRDGAAVAEGPTDELLDDADLLDRAGL